MWHFGKTLLRKGLEQARPQLAAKGRSVLFSDSAAIQEIKEVQIEVPWGHIAVKQWGDENLPIIICCHGFCDNAGSFDNIIPLLSRRFAYLAFDSPGHGLSSHAAEGLGYTDIFYMLSLEYVRRYYGNKQVGLIGHSMGGAQSLYYTHLYQKYVKFCVSIEFAALPYNLFVERLMHCGRRIDKLIAQSYKKGKPPLRTFKEQLYAMIAGRASSIDQKAAEILMKREGEKIEDLWRVRRDHRCQFNQVFGKDPTSFHQLIPERKEISYCLIEGIDGSRNYPTSHVKDVLKDFSNNYSGQVEYHAINGMHHVHLTNAERVAPIVNKFLDTVAPP